MTDDLNGDIDLDEAHALQMEAKAQEKVRWARSVAIASLLLGIGLLPTGRSLVWHAVGYLAAAVFATTGMAYSARKAALLRNADAPVQVRWLVLFNAVCLTVAVLHMVYVARRLV